MEQQVLSELPKFLKSKFNLDENYKEYEKRIKRTLYYGHLPSEKKLASLSLTGVMVEKFGKFCKQDRLNRLSLLEGSSVCTDASVTPCSVIVALMYLERLRTQNPSYLTSTSPSQVFLVALMIASKYLYDDGEEDEVYNDEWAESAAMTLATLNEAEIDFLSAIDWNLFVDVKSFMNELLKVETDIAIDHGLKRGFYIYSDIVTLSNSLAPMWTSILKLVGSAFVVCLIGYTATVCIIVTGTLTAKECAVRSTNHIIINVFPSSKLPLAVSNCNLGLDCQEGLLSISSTSEDEIALNISDIVEESTSTVAETEEREVGQQWFSSVTSSFHARIRTLQTITAALFVASSLPLDQEANETESLDCTSGCDTSCIKCTQNLNSNGRIKNFQRKRRNIENNILNRRESRNNIEETWINSNIPPEWPDTNCATPESNLPGFCSFYAFLPNISQQSDYGVNENDNISRPFEINEANSVNFFFFPSNHKPTHQSLNQRLDLAPTYDNPCKQFQYLEIGRQTSSYLMLT